MSGPLSGIVVLEVGHMLAGPYCGMLLADLGAEVIKIEPPEGDIARRVSPHSIGPHNAYFASLNRSKKSVVLDLASAAGRSALHRLAARARAHRQSAPRGDPEARSHLRGPQTGEPEAGVRRAHRLRPRGQLRGPPGLRLRDPGADRRDGHYRRTGRPAGEDRLFGSGQLGRNDGRARPPGENCGGQRRPDRPVHVRRDAVAAQLPRRRLAQCRRARRAHAALEPLFRSDTTASWSTRLAPLGVVVAPIESLEQALASDLVREREMVVAIACAQGTIRAVGNPLRIAGTQREYGPPPLLGEHNAMLLEEAGAGGAADAPVRPADDGRGPRRRRG